MPSSDSRDAATWGVLFALFVLTSGLLGLMAMVAPHVFGIVLIIAGFLGFGALHYLIWGWWLQPMLTESKETAGDRSDLHSGSENHSQRDQYPPSATVEPG